jgi:hypothetical protein
MDSPTAGRENATVVRAGSSRRRIARSLNTAYADGLLSEDTFVGRLDQLLRSRVIDPLLLIGDLSFRRGNRSRALSIKGLLGVIVPTRHRTVSSDERSAVMLALDWSGETSELLIGRHPACDVVLCEDTVSRRHARLVFRDGKWIIRDLRSTNGTAVNGTYVGRCELRPGDRLVLGDQCLAVD